MIGETPLLAGVLIGLSVTAPIGPMGVLCIQRTLAGGIASGICTGLGATTTQLCYAATFLLGLHGIGPDLMRAFAVAGGLLLMWFGLRLLRRQVRLSVPRRASPASMLATFTSALALNACNPMLVLLIAGATTSIAGPATADRGTAWLLLGVMAGSIGWWIALSGATAALRARLRPGMLEVLNQISAASLLGFGALALSRAVWP